ncbi:MAG: tetratricopeptide repeat protein [Planctomycetota bacterium]
MIRPQPVDLAPWPLGGLLVPDVEGGEELCHAATRGLPIDDRSEPTLLRYFELAAEDDTEGALSSLQALDGLEGDENVIVRYNQLVLDPSEARLSELRSLATEGPIADMVELAAFKSGLREDIPDTPHLDGELLASARIARATAALEAGDVHAASGLLDEAIQLARDSSPGLAAQLALSLVEIERQRGKGEDRLVELLRDSIELTAGEGFKTLTAEAQLELGVVLQEAGPQDHRRLTEASALFQDALLALDPESHPRAHGFAQMRLGLTYLSMPMHDAGDALRMGVATQALQRAVDVLDADREPDLWCSAASNLANAYQLLPSGHLGDNLDKAIGLYDDALGLRRGAGDPGGVARLLVNKAQAAASLERHDVAIASLEEACPLMAELRWSDDLNAARHMMEDLKRMTTARADDPAKSSAGPGGVNLA